MFSNIQKVAIRPKHNSIWTKMLSAPALPHETRPLKLETLFSLSSLPLFDRTPTTNSFGDERLERFRRRSTPATETSE